jgi:hypothetical protein
MKRDSKTCVRKPFFLLLFFLPIYGVKAQNLQTIAGNGNTTSNAIRLTGEGIIVTSGGGELALMGVYTTKRTNDSRAIIGWKNSTDLNNLTDGLAGTLILQARSDIPNVPINFLKGQGTPQLRIRIAGNGGIGTTNLFSILDVRGDKLLISGTNSSTGGISIYHGKLGITADEVIGNYGKDLGMKNIEIWTSSAGTLAGIKNASLDKSGNALFKGNVGVGIDNPTERLTVNGNIVSKKVRVNQTGWPDYVFEEKYLLLPLLELSQFIKSNKHLPEVPTEKEVSENGLDLGDMNALLLKKVEELTLYVVDLQNQVDSLKKQTGKNTRN